MASDGRNAEEIRLQLSNEREQLVGAIADLREDVQSARRIPMIIGGALLAGIAAFAAFKAVQGRGD
jgi:Na+/melibiose symporter-like transporter